MLIGSSGVCVSDPNTTRFNRPSQLLPRAGNPRSAMSARRSCSTKNPRIAGFPWPLEQSACSHRKVLNLEISRSLRMHRVKKELARRLEAFPFPFSSKKYLQSMCCALFPGGIALLVTQALQISRNLHSSLAALIFPWWMRMITRSKCLVVGPLAHAYNIRKTSI